MSAVLLDGKALSARMRERLRQEAAALPRGTAVIYLGWLCAGGIKGLKGARRRFRTAAGSSGESSFTGEGNIHRE